MTICGVVGPEHLERVASAVSSACSLPAVATQNWCDLAAGTFLNLKPNLLVSVTVATVSSGGDVVSVDSTGLASTGAGNFVGERQRLAPSGRVSWWSDAGVGTEAPVAIALSGLPSHTAWAASENGRRWARLGVRELVVGVAPIGGGSRYLMVQMGVLDGSPSGVDAGDAAVVRATLGEVGRRASMAFASHPDDEPVRLTAREQEILAELASGKTVKQIAESLCRSPHTIHDHVKSLHRKLYAASRGELIARALGHITTCTGGSARRRREEPGTRGEQNGNGLHGGPVSRLIVAL